VEPVFHPRIPEASLGRESFKDPSRTKRWKKRPRFVLLEACGEPFAASRVCDELAALALDPATGAPGTSCPLTTPTPL
jgi:hypothetical protein